MVNAGDLFVCTVAGLAIPLAMLDGFKLLAGSALPTQSAELRFERRALVWILALVLGPGLFADRMLAAWRAGALSLPDRINALVITLGWAAIHGYVLLSLVKTALPN